MVLILGLFLSALLVEASPVAVPQAVTQAISPSGSAPPGCSNSHSSTFGIAVVNITATPSVQRRDKPTAVIENPVSQIFDGQIQAPTAMTIAHVAQIGDGQVRAGMHTIAMMPVTEASGFGTTWMPANATPAPAPTPSSSPPATSSACNGSVPLYTVPSNSSTSSAAPPSPSPSPAPALLPASNNTGTTMVACKTNTTLSLSLSDGILTDAHGRTGYIASNFQFQFDNPPQSEALFTSGWSICSNGILSLGGSTVFWQCLSGNFYNLYDRDWAAQCNPVDIRVVDLISCA